MKTIVVAVFVKDDLIQKQIDNLLSLEGIDNYNIIFYQDSLKGSPKFNTEKYLKKNKNVSEIIKNNISKFHNADFLQSEINIRPFGLCKKSLDYAFNKGSDFCIFLEDDVFLDKNSLYWFNYFFDNG